MNTETFPKPMCWMCYGYANGEIIHKQFHCKDCGAITSVDWEPINNKNSMKFKNQNESISPK